MVRPIHGWASMLRQTVSIAPMTGRDVQGKPTYGSATSYRCRLVGERRQVLDAQGQQVMSRQTVYLMTNAIVHPEDRITLSTADIGSTESWAITPPILASSRYPDNSGGFHHTVVFLK